MFTVVSVSNPIYAGLDSTNIDCDVVWLNSETGENTPSMRYTASTSDTATHGSALYDGLIAGTYGAIQPYIAPIPVLADYRQTLSDIRYAKEVQGITIDSIPIQTDRVSRQAMMEKVTESMMNGMTTVTWKLASGAFNVYTIQDFREVYRQVSLYVEACFSNENTLYTALGNAEDPATIDLQVGWTGTEITTS